MKTIQRLWLRWCYGFNMSLAYLASYMDGQPDMAVHESAARQVERRLIVLGIQ